MGMGMLRMSEEEFRDFKNRNPAKVHEPVLITKPAKYRNTKKVVHGVTFDSTKEAKRYFDLYSWQMSGQITELETHKVFEIRVNGEVICDYEADFSYKRDGKLIVEDTKSKVTRKLPVYRLKNKLMLAVYGIEIQEV